MGHFSRGSPGETCGEGPRGAGSRAPPTKVLVAAADEVSTSVATLPGAVGQESQLRAPKWRSFTTGSYKLHLGQQHERRAQEGSNGLSDQYPSRLRAVERQRGQSVNSFSASVDGVS
ncbi:PE family protein [Mycobacterium servetii]|uniref:PE family protein n=1 Tax=Mycobacterium servetii TaxID=3237418 RepID=A0ABV4BZH6_9MYCO